MTRLSEIIHEWVGWCPNTGSVRTAPAAIATPPVTIHPGQPGGGAGGSGKIDRGINLAIGSLRILIGNRQLLWFSFLTGLVLVFSLVTTMGIQSLSGTDPLTGRYIVTDLQPALIVKGSAVWLAMTFASQLVITFCTAFLLAGLIVCVSLLLSGRTASIREGLSGVGTHLLPITGWAVFFTSISFVQSVVPLLYPGDVVMALISVILIFPVAILTVFVIPVVVLEGKGLAGAVTESFFLIRKTWVEILLFFFFFMVIGFTAGLVSLVPAAAVGFPSGSPVLLALSVALYMLVILILTMIFSTAFGIFLVGLHSCTRTGRIPTMFEDGKKETVPA